jgi:hypothetical protein
MANVGYAWYRQGRASLKNIDLFNEIAAWAFAQLYSAHPITCSLRCAELPSAIAEKLRELPPVDQGQFFTRTLLWLVENGFVSASTVSGVTGDILNAGLTLQGFKALSAVPASLQSGETVGSKISEMAKDAGKTAWTKAIGDLVGTVIGAAGKAMTS